MLFTLKAPRAYLPFKALANRSRVWVSGIFRSRLVVGPGWWTVEAQTLRNVASKWKTIFGLARRVGSRDRTASDDAEPSRLTEATPQLELCCRTPESVRADS